MNGSGDFVDMQLGGEPNADTSTLSVNYNGWLTIENIQEADLGSYEVVVSNQAGSAVHEVLLELNAPTVATSQFVSSLSHAPSGW